VKPSVIFLENVPEFASWGPLTDAGNPDKARAGETFQLSDEGGSNPSIAHEHFEAVAVGAAAGIPP
jgi:hypothetical protein